MQENEQYIDSDNRQLFSSIQIQNYEKESKFSKESIGELSILLEDENITDLVINAPNDVWVDRGEGLEKVNAKFLEIENLEKLRTYAVKLATLSGERLDDSKPIVDSKLNNSIRLHGVLPPISYKYPYITLRIPKKNNVKFEEMLATGTIPSEWEEFFRKIILDKLNIMISGSTSSGKTTLMKSLIQIIDKNQRIICIEETKEIDNVDHPHYISLSARRKNQEEKGEIKIQELVKSTLRMRPDRILLGEIRGEEINDLFSAFNTGHKGGICTIHSNSLKSIPSRIESLLGGQNMDSNKIALKTALAIDIFIQIEKVQTKRVVTQIGIPIISNNKLEVEIIAKFDKQNNKVLNSVKFVSLMET